MAILPFDQRDGSIWMDGTICDWRDAKVHVLTHGLHYGSCVFDGERSYGGSIFKSVEHSTRFRRSATLLGFDIPYGVPEIEMAKAKVLSLNGGGDQYIRTVAWRGSEMMALGAQQTTIHVAIASWNWPSMFDPARKMKGIKLDIADFRRPDPRCAPFIRKQLASI
jgi:branched-chain amino acid aminotransferase